MNTPRGDRLSFTVQGGLPNLQPLSPSFAVPRSLKRQLKVLTHRYRQRFGKELAPVLRSMLRPVMPPRRHLRPSAACKPDPGPQPVGAADAGRSIYKRGMRMKTKIALLLFVDTEVLDFAGPFEVFSVTDALHQHRLCTLSTVCQDTAPCSTGCRGATGYAA